MSKTRTFDCICFGPKGAALPTFGTKVDAPDVKTAKLIASERAIKHGWPSIRKVETREIK